jgi:hypothetical protein
MIANYARVRTPVDQLVEANTEVVKEKTRR